MTKIEDLKHRIDWMEFTFNGMARWVFLTWVYEGKKKNLFDLLLWFYEIDRLRHELDYEKKIKEVMPSET